MIGRKKDNMKRKKRVGFRLVSDTKRRAMGRGKRKAHGVGGK